MRCRLAPIVMTVNCYKFEFSPNFTWIRTFGTQQRLHEWR